MLIYMHLEASFLVMIVSLIISVQNMQSYHRPYKPCRVTDQRLSNGALKKDQITIGDTEMIVG